MKSKKIKPGVKLPLFVAEINTSKDQAVESALETIATTLTAIGGEFIESQVTADHNRIFAVLEHESIVDVENALDAAGLDVEDLAKVRLVGAELDDVKKLKKGSQYLVEWDFPEGLTMDKYLARKKEKSPLYDDIDDVKFLRTYVREDMVKCLCFYDGESEDAIVNARKVVDTPISRLHKLES